MGRRKKTSPPPEPSKRAKAAPKAAAAVPKPAKGQQLMAAFAEGTKFKASKNAKAADDSDNTKLRTRKFEGEGAPSSSMSSKMEAAVEIGDQPASPGVPATPAFASKAAGMEVGTDDSKPDPMISPQGEVQTIPAPSTVVEASAQPAASPEVPAMPEATSHVQPEPIMVAKGEVETTPALQAAVEIRAPLASPGISTFPESMSQTADMEVATDDSKAHIKPGPMTPPKGEVETPPAATTNEIGLHAASPGAPAVPESAETEAGDSRAPVQPEPAVEPHEVEASPPLSAASQAVKPEPMPAVEAETAQHSTMQPEPARIRMSTQQIRKERGFSPSTSLADVVDLVKGIAKECQRALIEQKLAYTADDVLQSLSTEAKHHVLMPLFGEHMNQAPDSPSNPHKETWAFGCGSDGDILDLTQFMLFLANLSPDHYFTLEDALAKIFSPDPSCRALKVKQLVSIFAPDHLKGSIGEAVGHDFFAEYLKESTRGQVLSEGQQQFGQENGPGDVQDFLLFVCSKCGQVDSKGLTCLADLVAAIRKVDWGEGGKWQVEARRLVASLPTGIFKSMLLEAKEHPCHEQFKMAMLGEFPPVDPDSEHEMVWSFGTGGDDFEDLASFVQWIVPEDFAKTPENVKPADPGHPLEIGLEDSQSCGLLSGSEQEECLFGEDEEADQDEDMKSTISSYSVDELAARVEQTREAFPKGGDILGSACKAMLAQLQLWDAQSNHSEILKSSKTWDMHWVIASGCSGTGAFEDCFAAVLQQLNADYGIDMKMTVAFGVENVPFKQAYLQKAWEKLGGTAAQACLFNDMCNLANEKRKCIAHPLGHNCDLPNKLSFYCSGFSCTSLSPLNSSSAANASAFAEHKAVQTVETFNGCLTVIQHTEPEIILLENVPKLDANPKGDDERTNLDFCIQKLSRVGSATYELKTFLAKSERYGVPQSRTRVYILGIRSDEIGSGAAQDILEKTKVHLKVLNLPLASVDRFLLPDDCAQVLDELARLEGMRAATGVNTGATSGSSQQWVHLHMAIAEKRNIHWPFEIPPQLEQSPWFQTLPSRQREVLALASLDRDRDPGSLRFADIYHSANRYATGPPSHVPVCLPRTTLWDFNRKRLLLGSELMMLQGIDPLDSTIMAEEDITQAQVGDLAGNAFTGPVVIAMLLAVLTAHSSPSVSKAEEDISIANMMESMVGLARVTK